MKISRKAALIMGISAVVLSAIRLDIYADEKAVSEFDHFFEDVLDHLVIIKTISADKETDHCGFIASMDNKTYLFTSQHLILGADKINFYSPTGRTIRPRSIELSQSRNIARLALSEGEGLSISQNPEMGASIEVYSSTEADDLKGFPGTISGIGAEIIEVSADFSNDHSGSPILDSDMNVIGIASYVRISSDHAMKKGTRFENRTRRFGYRLDRANWKVVNWKSFNKEYGTPYREAAELKADIIKILNSWHDSPFDRVQFNKPLERNLKAWANTHNSVVSSYQKDANYNRKFSAEYTKSTSQLAAMCRSKAKKVRMISEQRGLTEFLLREYDMQASTLENAADVIDHYGTSAY